MKLPPYEYEYDDLTMVHFNTKDGDVTDMVIETIVCDTLLDVTEVMKKQDPVKFERIKEQIQEDYDHSMEEYS